MFEQKIIDGLAQRLDEAACTGSIPKQKRRAG
jgi:hypothetical protein